MPGIARTNNSELAALVTGDLVKADELADEYNIKAWSYEQYGALLASGEIDAVYVATPNVLHTPFVVAALEANIHVLLEKPMASSVAEAEQMLAAQQKSGAKLMIAYRLHHEPGTVELFTRAQNEDFGELRAFSSVFAERGRSQLARPQWLLGRASARHGDLSAQCGPQPLRRGTHRRARHWHEDAGTRLQLSRYGGRDPALRQ